MLEPRPLHRLFGLSWTDFFQGTDVEVELEVDLSHRHQLLDVVLIRKGAGPIAKPLPDGFEELAPHNLVTFKSHQESLDGWSLCELIGHYVNYRKQTSPTMQELLPDDRFRLYAVCVRHPQNLIASGALRPVRAGVFDAVFAGLATVRVIVVHQLPQAEHNAMLHLFSAKEDLLRYGRDHYRPRSADTSTLLYQLFQAYQEESEMATQLKEFVRQTIDQLLEELPPEELRKHLTRDERLEGLSPEERLEGLSPEERLEGLSPEERLEGLSPEERLEGLSPEEMRAALEALRRRLGTNDASSASH